MDIPEGRIRADRLDIEFDQAPLSSNEPQRVKLSNMPTLPQKNPTLANCGSLTRFPNN